MAREAIIVTGSSGLIGKAVVHRFANDFDVIGFDRPGFPHPPEEAECVDVDLANDESVRAAFDQVKRDCGNKIASVIHLAAYYSFSGEPSPLYEQVTVRGTERLLRELSCCEVGQFIFSSTMLVHAACEPGQFISENWPLEPKWDYPASKVETEELIRRKRGCIPAVMMRIAGVYDDLGHSIPIANQIQRIYERKLTSRVYPGSTSHGQSFVHLDDVVEAIWLAVQKRRELPPEFPVLIGEPVTLSYDELQHTIARLIHGDSWETQQIPKAMAKTGAWLQDLIPGEDPFIKPWMVDLADDHYAIDITRAREMLGWEPKHSLRDSLPMMIDFLKRDPEGFYRENHLEGEPVERKRAVNE